MNNYGFNIPNNNINIIDWAHRVNARNDAKAKESRDNMMNTMKMLGLAGAAYKGNPDFNITREDQDAFEADLNLGWDNLNTSDKMSLINAGYNPSLFTNNLVSDNNLWGV